jgi:hypothetical protein
MANQIKATEKLAELRRLPMGWDYGRGGPISGGTYRTASLLINTLAGLGAADFDVVPGAGDCAVVVGYRGNKSAEISCLANGSYELLHEEGDKEGEIVTDLSLDGVTCLLEEYGWQSPKFYASCIQNVMYRVSDGTVVMPSKTPQMGVGYQRFARLASPQVGRTHVIIYPDSTRNESAETRQSSGEFQSLPWAMELA